MNRGRCDRRTDKELITSIRGTNYENVKNERNGCYERDCGRTKRGINEGPERVYNRVVFPERTGSIYCVH